MYGGWPRHYEMWNAKKMSERWTKVRAILCTRPCLRECKKPRCARSCVSLLRGAANVASLAPSPENPQHGKITRRFDYATNDEFPIGRNDRQRRLRAFKQRSLGRQKHRVAIVERKLRGKSNTRASEKKKRRAKRRARVTYRLPTTTTTTFASSRESKATCESIDT